jgi:hypothetical protein
LLTLVLAGCGASSFSPAEAHLVSVAKGVCRDTQGMGLHAQLHTELQELSTLIRSDRHLPRVAKLLADEAQSRKLRAEMRQDATHGIHTALGAKAQSLIAGMDQIYPLALKIYADEKALGLACAGSPPRKPIGG